MRLGWFHYYLGKDDPVARGFFTTAFHLYQGFSDVEKQVGISENPKWFTRPDGVAEPVHIIDIGTKTYLKHHLRKAGLDACFHFCPPHRFLPIPWTRNILFTMWEAPVIDPKMKALLGQADTIIVPSSFVQETFRRELGLESVVVPLGVGPQYLATDTTRRVIRGPGTPRLRFLYVGSNDPRKGFQLIPHAWKKAFETRPDAAYVQLYMKGIHPDEKQRNVIRPYNDERVIIDRRDLGPEELAQLYQSADVFIFPSLGEGFGLPPLEAMASGCLVAATNAGGLNDFIRSDVARVIARPKEISMSYGLPFKTRIPTVESIAEAILDCYNHWGKPHLEGLRQRGTRAARAMTWENTINLTAEEILGRFIEESEDEEAQVQGTSARGGRPEGLRVS